LLPGRWARTEHAVDHSFSPANELYERGLPLITRDFVRLASVSWGVDDDSAFLSTAVPEFKMVGAIWED
jgi:hypothetical protein